MPATSPRIDDSAEFVELALSAGAEVVGEVTAPLRKPDPSTLLGPGKVDEIGALKNAVHSLTAARDFDRQLGASEDAPALQAETARHEPI